MENFWYKTLLKPKSMKPPRPTQRAFASKYK